MLAWGWIEPEWEDTVEEFLQDLVDAKAHGRIKSIDYTVTAEPRSVPQTKVVIVINGFLGGELNDRY